MTNQIPNFGREGFLVGSIGWTGAKATTVPYIFGSMGVAFDAITFLSDVPAAVWRARGTYLVSKTTPSGIADAADTLIAAVGSAGSATAVSIGVVWETGASNTSIVGAMIDVATGMPFLPNGGDVQVVWDDGSNKIFRL